MCCRSGQLIFALSNWMGNPECTDEIRNRWLDIWGQVCAQLLTWQLHVPFAGTPGLLRWCVPCPAVNMHGEPAPAKKLPEWLLVHTGRRWSGNSAQSSTGGAAAPAGHKGGEDWRPS